MRSMRRRFVASLIGMAAAAGLAVPKASADILPDPSSTWLEKKHVVLEAGRFDAYCEHRHAIAKGDTFESIATSAYGDAKRAKEIAAANPTFEAGRLPVGGSIVLPPKESPPKDATETLAWEFWIYCNLSGYMPLTRVHPGEKLEVAGKFLQLVAIPAEHHDELVKWIADAKEAAAERTKELGRDFLQPDRFVKTSPWALKAKGFWVHDAVDRSLGVVEGTTTVRIVELVATTKTPGRFVVKNAGLEYRDRAGNVVKAGFDLLLSWRGIPLGLIVLVGYFGLRRMKRSRVAALVLGAAFALGVAAPDASADVAPMGIKQVEVRLILRADRFDDYCEHRHVLAQGDTFEAIAKKVYGDAARAKDIAAANPALEATRLPIGAKVVLPPKLAPPKDAKETLAWAFWGWTRRLDLQRVYPDETMDSEAAANGLLAIPADRLAEFEKLLDAARPKDPKPSVFWVKELKARLPWLIPANLFVGEPFVKDDSPAAQSVSTYRIAELAAGLDSPGRFVVERVSVEYRDQRGNVVKAGFDLLLTWRGIPLGLIALVGAIGLQRMRRQCAARS